MMKLRLAAPSVLVDVGRLAELAGRADGDELAIGAMTRHADLAASDLVRAEAPLLAHAAAHVGDPQVRHRGTIGGSLAHADPAADLPMALLAAGRIGRGRTARAGARGSAADDFFARLLRDRAGAGRDARGGPGAARAGPAWGYQKFVRRANDWAIVGVAATAGRVALANMGPAPLRASATEQALAGGATRRGRRGWPPTAPSPARTSTPTATTAGTWPAC